MHLKPHKQNIRDSVRTFYGDLPLAETDLIKTEGLVAWDIETSGLSWRQDKIATCQVFVPNHDVFLIQFNGADKVPSNLRSLMTDSAVLKIFHHAMFDLRFMAAHWGVTSDSVVCTKIASKLLQPVEKDHSLQCTLHRYLDIYIDKDPRISNWLRDDLSNEQLEYAVGDVIYLPRLFSTLKAGLETNDRWHIATKIFEFLPVRVQLDLLGAGDVFSY